MSERFLHQKTSLQARKMLAIVAACAGLMLLPALGSFGIMDPSDGLYAEAAREMLESGNYLTPHFNYAPFLEKPILVYWFIAASFKVFGVSEFAARLPAAVAAIETACFVFWTAKSYVSLRTAFFCSMVMLSNLLFAVIGHLALTDMELTCFATMAALSLFQFINTDGRRSWQFFTAGCFCLAVTCLLKGPVIVVLCGITLLFNKLLLNFVSAPDDCLTFWQYVRRVRIPAAAVVILALTAPWYLAENFATNGAFFQEFFIRQNLGRINGTINHIDPPWFYLPYLLITFMPFLMLVPLLIAYIKRLAKRRPPISKRVRLLVFTLSWSIACFLFFSLIRTKLPTYILPGVPMACITLGIVLDLLCRMRSSLSRIYSLCFASFFGFISISGIALLVFGWTKLNGWSDLTLYGFLASILASITGALMIFLFSDKAKKQFPAKVAVLSWLVAMMFLTPSSLLYYYRVKHADLRAIVLDAAGANLATFWRDTTAGVFYHRKKVVLVMTVEDLESFKRTSERPHRIIVTADLIPFVKLEAHNPNLPCLETRGNYSLFDLDAAN